MEKLMLILLGVFLFSHSNVLGQPSATLGSEEMSLPLNDIVERQAYRQRKLMTYPDLRENDLLWEKRVWRLIDTREKMNLIFRYPQSYFFQVLLAGIEQGSITAYSPENDAFQIPMRSGELQSEIVWRDTIPVFNPETLEASPQIVENTLDPAKITRYRVQEIWYFDKRHGTLNVRILGIAPMITERDDMGNFKYERPLFWVYYPACREWLARQELYLEGNDHRVLTWADLFEMRRFSSYITKESNLHDLRLQDLWSGVDRLLESDKIHRSIFDYEDDLWSR